MRIIFFGPPGAGKGTQAGLLSKKLNVVHLSTGEILRSKLNDEDDLAKKLKFIMSSGKLVSDEILNKIVSDKLNSDDCLNGFILDGYPRTLKQLEYFNHFINAQNIVLDQIINIHLDSSKIEKRILLRSNIENRQDDNLEVIRDRIKTYNKETVPVLLDLKEKNKDIFYEIDGDHKIEHIQLELAKIVKNC